MEKFGKSFEKWKIWNYFENIFHRGKMKNGKFL